MTASLLLPLAMAVVTLEITATDGVVAVDVATMGPSSSSLVMATQQSGMRDAEKRNKEKNAILQNHFIDLKISSQSSSSSKIKINTTELAQKNTQGI